MFMYNSPKLTDVRLQDGFLAPRQHTNGKVTLPSAVQKCHDTGHVDAFRMQWRPGMPKHRIFTGIRILLKFPACCSCC